MNTWLRLHRYALARALRRMAAQPFSAAVNLLVMGLALALPLLGASILLSVQPVARQLSVTPELTIFLKPGAPNEAAPAIAARVQRDYAGQVAAAQVAPRDQALADLRANPSWHDALTALDSNPLPDAVVVTLAPGDDLAERAASLTAQWQKWDQVDKVQLDSDWVRRLEALLRFGRIGLWFLAVCVAVAVLAAVFNTVRLHAMTQRDEIAVARLVGATESFVRRPFLYLGALSGAAAALLSIAAAALALQALNQAVLTLARSYGVDFMLSLPSWPALLAWALGTGALGALSARWSVTRNTRF